MISKTAFILTITGFFLFYYVYLRYNKTIFSLINQKPNIDTKNSIPHTATKKGLIKLFNTKEKE